MIQPNDLYTANDIEIRVHEVKNGQVYFVKYNKKDRGNLSLDPQNCELLRTSIENFEQALINDGATFVWE
jgi:hypothetical protein